MHALCADAASRYQSEVRHEEVASITTLIPPVTACTAMIYLNYSIIVFNYYFVLSRVDAFNAGSAARE